MPSAPPPEGPLDTIPKNAPRFGYPATRNDAFSVPERPLTDRIAASSYTNFYEFDGTSKEVWHLTADYKPYPWTIEVAGMVEKEMVLDVETLIRQFGLEERLYRFRCVEAWAMVVPWTGFPLRALLDRVQPMRNAHFVRFWSVDDASLPGVETQPWYPWPYYEGLRLDEAMHELSFVALGMYGRELRRQHGAPVRLVVPWKYGFKSIKSITRIELVAEKPPTFWNRLEPREYGFYANVDPARPHPRWSQAHHRMLDTQSRVETAPYNGYGELVSHLYPMGPSHKA